MVIFIMKSRQDDSQLTLNTRKMYSIFFSKDRKNFLDQRNRDRLIALRNKNPEAAYSFIYSSNLLDESAKVELNNFCQRHRIQAVDFDTEIATDRDKSEKESKLFGFVRGELENWVGGNRGGNPAAASDMLRYCQSVIKRCGAYVELDTDVDLSSLPQRYNIKHPIIMPKESNDFIGVATKANGEIHEQAKQYLERFQDYIIEGYEIEKSDKGVEQIDWDAPIMYEYFSQIPGADKSLTAFRSFIKNANIDDFLKAIRPHLKGPIIVLKDTFHYLSLQKKI